MFLLLRPLVRDPRFCREDELSPGAPLQVVAIGGGGEGGSNGTAATSSTDVLFVEVKPCANSPWVFAVEVMVMVFVVYVLVAYKGSMLLYVCMARVLRNAFAAWNQWAEDMFQHVGESDIYKNQGEEQGYSKSQ